MKPEVKKLWVDALRSGQYLPCDNHLTIRERIGDEYVERHCALGVLCDIAVNEGVLPPSDYVDAVNGWGHTETVREYIGGVTDHLPLPVIEWADLPNSNPSLRATMTRYDWDLVDDIEVEDMYPIASLNDEFDVDFGTLARLIEEQF